MPVLEGSAKEKDYLALGTFSESVKSPQAADISEGNTGSLSMCRIGLSLTSSKNTGPSGPVFECILCPELMVGNLHQALPSLLAAGSYLSNETLRVDQPYRPLHLSDTLAPGFCLFWLFPSKYLFLGHRAIHRVHIFKAVCLCHTVDVVSHGELLANEGLVRDQGLQVPHDVICCLGL